MDDERAGNYKRAGRDERAGGDEDGAVRAAGRDEKMKPSEGQG